MSLTQSQLESFHRDGYVIVPDVYTPDAMDAALAACERAFYGRPFAEHLAAHQAGNAEAGVRDGFTTAASTARTQFPVGEASLDDLIGNNAYLDMFEQCLGGRGSYCNAHLFLRCGITDKRYAEHPWEGWHIDHDTNCLLPPSEQFGKYDYINSGVYLHDVELDGAPMLVIPGSHRVNVWPQVIADGNLAGRGAIRDIRRVKGLADPVPAVGPKGSALFYSSSLIHAAQPFANKQKQRAFWTLSMARREHAGWKKFANPFTYGERDFLLPFLCRSSARVRSLFGWPEAGDPYFTANTIDLLEHWIPGMDVSEYRTALAS
jgi:ectoine hydroxylase-related dioxygenase (phytanoyl-CoA dioxygenase family)